MIYQPATAIPITRPPHNRTLPHSRTEWATPREFVDLVAATLPIDHMYFDLDPCCDAGNCKARHGYTIEDDGLIQPWEGFVWVNPPYGSENINKWHSKAMAEIQAGRSRLVVMLLPNNTETDPWQRESGIFDTYAATVFVKGRIPFISPVDGKTKRANTRGSVVVYLGDLRGTNLNVWRGAGHVQYGNSK
jgi:phage N-6-adenine-methyltransferase